MDAVKVFLNHTKEGAVTCPACGLGKKMSLAPYQEYFGGKSLKLRCKRCQTSFPVKFDHRHYTRVKVDFPGKIRQTAPDQETPRLCKHVVITSVSVVGVGFLVSDLSTLKVNDVLDIRFRLDDPDQSLIQERITVKRIDGTSVGAEYADDTYRYELDFYVMRQ